MDFQVLIGNFGKIATLELEKRELQKSLAANEQQLGTYKTGLQRALEMMARSRVVSMNCRKSDLSESIHMRQKFKKKSEICIRVERLQYFFKKTFVFEVTDSRTRFHIFSEIDQLLGQVTDLHSILAERCDSEGEPNTINRAPYWSVNSIRVATPFSNCPPSNLLTITDVTALAVRQSQFLPK